MTMSSFWDRTTTRLRESDTTGFLILALLVGFAVGLGAWILVWAIHGTAVGVAWIEGQFGRGSILLLLLIPVGLLAANWIARTFAPEVEGDGVPESMAALAVRNGYLSTKSIPFKIIASALTLGVGGSAGREGPMVQVGAAIGSSLSRRFHLREDQIRSLVAAGAGAAIGASFNAPIAGMLFALEVVLGSFAVRHMSAVVVASVAAAVTFRRLPLPPESLLTAAPYQLLDARELLLYAGLALLAVVVSVAFLRFIAWVERQSERFARIPYARPVTAGVILAAVGFIDPRALGTGQEFVSELLRNQLFAQVSGASQIAWWVLFALVIAKVFATSITIASGGSGGAFMPSLFIGSALGAGFAQLIAPYWGYSPINPGAFAVVGMATVFASVARAPLTAILIVFEVTGARDYGLVLPLMLAATFATFLTERFQKETVYTMPLARKGIKLLRSSDIDLLDTVTCGDVSKMPQATLRSDMTLTEAQQLLDRYRHHGLPVLDDGRLVGILTVTDILRADGDPGSVRVGEVMTAKPVTVTPSTPVSEAMEKMAALGVGRLPMVSDADPEKLVGVFRREDAVRAYHRALGSTTDHSLVRERLKQRTDPGTAYFQFRIPPRSMADGKSVREIAWPEGSTLVSIRRGTTVLVPTGDTVLRSGDVITAFGTDLSRTRMVARLNAGAEEPTAEIDVVAGPDS